MRSSLKTTICLLGQNKSSMLFCTNFNMRFLRQIAYIITTLILTGCGDCFQRAEGVVLDNDTKMPIDSVTIAPTSTTKNTEVFPANYSTKNGQFKFRKISGGITHCPDLTLYFYKKGFKQNRSTFSSESINDTIYLEKLVTTVDPTRH